MSVPTVTNVEERHRYEIEADGALAGFAAYVDAGNRRVFHHTEIDKAFGGRGLGTTLIAAALADTTAAGKRIVPTCSFVEAYAGKHAEYAALVDPVTPEVQAALAALQH